MRKQERVGVPTDCVAKSHRPRRMDPPVAMVSSIMVLPASVPTPTATCSWASSREPMPEKMTMRVSGSAPSTGSTRPGRVCLGVVIEVRFTLRTANDARVQDFQQQLGAVRELICTNEE